jgi:thiol-disulfide isomerase/thioredoxin
MKRRCGVVLLSGVFSLLLALGSLTAGSKAHVTGTTVGSTYPGLASGVLMEARLEDLPEGVVLRAEGLEITPDDLDTEISKHPASLQAELKKNGFFLLKQIATERLLLQVARKNAGQGKTGDSESSAIEIIKAYLRGVVEQVKVTEAEVKGFYEENRTLFGGAELPQVQEQLRQYLLQAKQQEVMSEHIQTLGQRVPILVSASWAAEQTVLVKDNPVDRARVSGKPTLVDFGATGCRPCDMMAPILADLKKKYDGKLNVLFVHVQEHQILAARYGVQGIPVQVFFDKDGKEAFRHTGFFPQAEIEEKLKAMGIK